MKTHARVRRAPTNRDTIRVLRALVCINRRLTRIETRLVRLAITSGKDVFRKTKAPKSKGA